MKRYKFFTELIPSTYPIWCNDINWNKVIEQSWFKRRELSISSKKPFFDDLVEFIKSNKGNDIEVYVSYTRNYWNDTTFTMIKGDVDYEISKTKPKSRNNVPVRIKKQIGGVKPSFIGNCDLKCDKIVFEVLDHLLDINIQKYGIDYR
jgi:hypothetical protein